VDLFVYDMGMTWGHAGSKDYLTEIVMVGQGLGLSGDVQTTQATTLPADAIVTSASAQITVREAGTIAAAKVAQVRQGENSKVVVIDFGALRTVAALELPSGRTLSTMRRWDGSGFASATVPPLELLQSVVNFAEIQTERLELTFSTATTAALVGEQLRVKLPGAPVDLSIEVGGVLAWSRPGAVRLVVPEGGDEPEASFTVPLAAELQAALARGGANPEVMLRTGTPCRQNLTLSVAHVRAHAVVLPPSGLVLAAETEAEVDAALPLPADSANWQVVQAELAVSGRLPSWRGWPLPDPAENLDARLVLDAAHSYAARLPAGWLAPLSEVSGVRLPLVLPAGFGGAELAAVLYEGDLDQPLTPLPGARFVPADLSPTPAGGLIWAELRLAKPAKVPPVATWWVEITATRGSCDWPLTQVVADTEPDAIRLRRSLPGPPFRPLAVQARRGVQALVPAGRLRLLGTPRSDDQRPGVVPLLQGSGTAQVAPGFTPSATSGTVTLTPTIPATAARGEIASNALKLRLRLHSAGQVTLSAATVFYRTP